MWCPLLKKYDTKSDTGRDYAEFYTEDMDVAIEAGFTIYIDEDKRMEYLLTNIGKEVEA